MPSYTARSILTDIEMDKDLIETVDKFKDIQMTPEQMNLKIQADRVIYILNRCLAKMNLIAHIPFFLQNEGALLKKHLKCSEAYFVLNVLSQWGHDVDFTEIQPEEYIADYLKIGTVNKYSKKSTSPKLLPENFPNPQVFQVVDILFYNKCLQRAVRLAVNPKLDKHVLSVVKLLQDLKDIAKSKVYVTGEEEKSMEKELRRAYKSNILLTAVINDLNDQLEKQRKELGMQLNEKMKVLQAYKEKMEKVQDNFEVEIKNTLRQSEKEMMQETLESEEKQTKLAEEAENITKQYEDHLASNLREEASSRAKRFKIETQLQNWINTFDQDIGEKQAQFDDLQAEYDQKKAEIDEVQKIIDEQEDEYDRLMAEKAEEEEKLYNEMAYQFFLDRSARKIQKYWRAYMEKRASKKKKGKKKK